MKTGRKKRLETVFIGPLILDGRQRCSDDKDGHSANATSQREGGGSLLNVTVGQRALLLQGVCTCQDVCVCVCFFWVLGG